MYWAAMILGLAMLMIVHESGHYFAARAFGMRVERFSIGFGPALWKHKPKGSDTTFQIAPIPLAFVQIAGMNPFEDIDPEDKGSYANASLFARVCAIFAGPLANYLFASIMIFAAALIGGQAAKDGTISVDPEAESAALTAGLQSGDRIVSIAGHPIKKWSDIPPQITPYAGERLEIVVERDGAKQSFTATPRESEGKGFLGVGQARVDVPMTEAARQGVIMPAIIIGLTVKSIGRMLTGQEPGQLAGPIRIGKEMKKAAEIGLAPYLLLVGFLSTSVGFFNMLPFPALDGGRLSFLAYEAVTRRRPNQKVEAQIHTVGLLVLLGTLVVVSFNEATSSDEEKDKPAAAAEDDKKPSSPDKGE